MTHQPFTVIYETDHWQGGSGQGSTAQASAPYRRILDRLLASPQVRSVVEVGCGDWQVGSLVDWRGARYLGVDVVDAVVEANRQRYSAPGRRFEVRDARTEDLPRADLLLVKDVLQHWPNGDIAAFLHDVVPRYRFALLTNDVASVHWPRGVNEDVALGAWRTLDLQAPPFGLRPRASWDFEVAGEWTKRVELVAVDRAWRMGEAVPRSVRRIARSV